MWIMGLSNKHYRRFVRSVAVTVTLVVVFATEVGAATKTKRKKPAAAKAIAIAPGKPCPAVGTTNAASGLDCVQVGGAKLWEQRGTKVNPFRLNDVGSYTAYEGNRYTLKVTGITTLAPADIVPGGTGKYAMPAGSVPVRVAAELTYLGPNDTNDLPASITSLVFVDASGKKYDTYAGDDKAGGGECSQFGDVPGNGTRNLAKGAPLLSLCVVLPSSSVGPKLLVNLSWLSEPAGIWFRTTV
jgi:hypothetical protein